MPCPPPRKAPWLASESRHHRWFASTQHGRSLVSSGLRSGAVRRMPTMRRFGRLCLTIQRTNCIPYGTMAEIVCSECGYRVNVVRTGPQSAKPEHELDEFQRLCREGPFETLAAT